MICYRKRTSLSICLSIYFFAIFPVDNRRKLIWITIDSRLHSLLLTSINAFDPIIFLFRYKWLKCSIICWWNTGRVAYKHGCCFFFFFLTKEIRMRLRRGTIFRTLAPVNQHSPEERQHHLTVSKIVLVLLNHSKLIHRSVRIISGWNTKQGVVLFDR